MIYLLRHGETVWNRQGRKQGRGDSPLTLRGVEQAVGYAEFLAERLAEANREEVVVRMSPLFRAWQTASIVADRLGIPDERRIPSELLAEFDFGSWQGSTDAELEARFPGEPAKRRADPWNYRVPGGENLEDVHVRARRWLAEERPEAITLLVGHGAHSRILRGAYLALAPREILALESHSHGKIFALDAGECRELLT